MAKSKTSSEAGLPRIFTVRKLKVVLDADLAKLYGVPAFRLNEAVKRNADRFPPEFSFLLTNEDVACLRSQIAILNESELEGLRSQIVTLKTGGRGAHRKYAPRVFTEHGALMAATVLRTERAIQMSLYLVRAFVEMREALLANATILKRLAEIDHRLVEHDSVLRELIDRLRPLLDAPAVDDDPKKKIGFHHGNR
jgi:hypothetical protein